MNFSLRSFAFSFFLFAFFQSYSFAGCLSAVNGVCYRYTYKSAYAGTTSNYGQALKKSISFSASCAFQYTGVVLANTDFETITIRKYGNQSGQWALISTSYITAVLAGVVPDFSSPHPESGEPQLTCSECPDGDFDGIPDACDTCNGTSKQSYQAAFLVATDICGVPVGTYCSTINVSCDGTPEISPEHPKNLDSYVECCQEQDPPTCEVDEQCNKKPSDSDGDGTPDSQDSDDDNDGTPDDQDSDDDGDGIPDSQDKDSDSDGDGTSDPQDDDDDGDGTPDAEDPDEKDTDGDGSPDKEDSDDDGDGIPDSEDHDIDGDGIPNDKDPDQKDTDGDGIPDAHDTDDDGDGIPDSQDDDSDGDGKPEEKDCDINEATRRAQRECGDIEFVVWENFEKCTYHCKQCAAEYEQARSRCADPKLNRATVEPCDFICSCTELMGDADRLCPYGYKVAPDCTIVCKRCPELVEECRIQCDYYGGAKNNMCHETDGKVDDLYCECKKPEPDETPDPGPTGPSGAPDPTGPQGGTDEIIGWLKGIKQNTDTLVDQGDKQNGWLSSIKENTDDMKGTLKHISDGQDELKKGLKGVHIDTDVSGLSGVGAGSIDGGNYGEVPALPSDDEMNSSFGTLNEKSNGYRGLIREKIDGMTPNVSGASCQVSISLPHPTASGLAWSSYSLDFCAYESILSAIGSLLVFLTALYELLSFI